jgi:hypothetical protein
MFYKTIFDKRNAESKAVLEYLSPRFFFMEAFKLEEILVLLIHQNMTHLGGYFAMCQ